MMRGRIDLDQHVLPNLTACEVAFIPDNIFWPQLFIFRSFLLFSENISSPLLSPEIYCQPLPGSG